MMDWQGLGELVEEQMREWTVPGVSVGVLQGGEYEGRGGVEVARIWEGWGEG